MAWCDEVSFPGFVKGSPFLGFSAVGGPGYGGGAVFRSGFLDVRTPWRDFQSVYGIETRVDV